MLTDLGSYIVEIKDISFTNDNGAVFPMTAIITHENRDGSKRSVDILGHFPSDDLYDLIEAGKPVILDYCYVNRFSLSEYRILKEMEKKEKVFIAGLSAKHAFFDCEGKIDFSYAEFGAGNINLEHAIFAKGLLSFNSANFGEGNICFNYALFNNGNVDFANTVFGQGEVSFKNCIFRNGTKDFQYADFGSGDVSFINAEFGDGDVSFINTVFHEGDISFKVARF